MKKQNETVIRQRDKNILQERSFCKPAILSLSIMPYQTCSWSRMWSVQ